MRLWIDQIATSTVQEWLPCTFSEDEAANDVTVDEANDLNLDNIWFEHQISWSSLEEVTSIGHTGLPV